MASDKQDVTLNGWFFGTARQYIVAPDGAEYWPRTELDRVRGLLQELQAGLRKFGWHTKGCAYTDRHQRYDTDCDCGYETLLRLK